jgi:hypothetical protein
VEDQGIDAYKVNGVQHVSVPEGNRNIKIYKITNDEDKKALPPEYPKKIEAYEEFMRKLKQ